MSLKTANLEDLVQRAKQLAELVMDDSRDHPFLQLQARDLLSRIRAHEAIYSQGS